MDTENDIDRLWAEIRGIRKEIAPLVEKYQCPNCDKPKGEKHECPGYEQEGEMCECCEDCTESCNQGN